MTARLACLLLIMVLVGTGAQAEEPWDSLSKGPETTVIGIIDGDTVSIDPPVNGAYEIRLVGVQAPKIPLGRKNFKTWPYGQLSKSVLEQLLKDRSVILYFAGRRMDRHGRVLAHLKRDDGLWVQGDMLERGMARVYSFPDNRAVVGQMLEIERSARSAKRGIWRHPFYGIRTSDDAKDYIGRFELIEGVVLDVAEVGKTTYINFTDDWRTDFTLTIKGKALRLFRDDGMDVMALKNHKIRVRGWLKSMNGPMINLTHPEQVEVIE